MKKSNFEKSGLDEDSIIYHLLTDRFYDGDPSNNDQGEGEYKPGDLFYFQGGDWKGITQKMDYIRELGMNAIQISPVHHAQWLPPEKTEVGYAGYHAYEVYDHSSPEPHFGTLEDLKELVETAHKKDISVIYDAVPNHTGHFLSNETGEFDLNVGSPAPPFDNPDWYHHNGDIEKLDEEESSEIRKKITGDLPPLVSDEYQLIYHDLWGLDDLAHEKLEVEEALNNIYSKWIEETNADGFRVDATRHMPKWYLHSFQEAVDVPCYGEAWIADPENLYDYQNYLWGLEDFPFMHAVREAIGLDRSCERFSEVFRMDRLYSNPNYLITFIDNHDVPRFLNLVEGDIEKLKIALGLNFTARGIPRVYYGTEQGFDGGIDPECRESMDRWDKKNEIYSYIKKLSEIRNELNPLRRGKQVELKVSEDTYSFSRIKDGRDIIVSINKKDEETKLEIPISEESPLETGNSLKNNLNREETTIKSNRNEKKIKVTFMGRGLKVFTEKNA